MSKAILTKILADLQVKLSVPDVDELHQELLVYFGLIGASQECAALEAAWRDPYNRRHIEEFIRAWLRRKRHQKPAPVPDIV